VKILSEIPHAGNRIFRADRVYYHTLHKFGVPCFLGTPCKRRNSTGKKEERLQKSRESDDDIAIDDGETVTITAKNLILDVSNGLC
jgi:hypothetical protein